VSEGGGGDMRIWALVIAMQAEAIISVAHARGSSELAGMTQPDDANLIVTGEKASRSLHDTVTSVAVATRRSMDDQALTSAYDILDRTPNVVADGSRTTFSIRGVDAFNVTGSGDGPLASVYVDGAAIPRLALAAGPLDIYDVDQVEIFRGPQSTIQGRNALAGAVFINTADPGFDWTAKERLILSDRDEGKRIAGVLGGPIAGDQLAFRLVGEVSRTDGLIRNATSNSDADQQGSQTIRGKLLFVPKAVVGLRIMGAFLRDRHRRGTFYTEFDPPFNPLDRISVADVQDVKRGTSLAATLTLDYDMGAGLTAKSVTSYSHIRFNSLSDADRTALHGQISQIVDFTRSVQQEMRLSIARPWIEGLIGVYYLREQRDYFYSARQNLSLTSLGIDRQLLAAGLPRAAVDAVLGLYGGMVPIRTRLIQPRHTENYAGFADFAYPVSSRLRLRLGLRYDSETQERQATQMVGLNSPLPDPQNAASPAIAPIVARLNALLLATIHGANSADPVSKVPYHAWLPKIALTYEPSASLAFSFTVQRGYRAGGSGLNQQRAEIYSFKPEYVTNYECALRSRWFDDRLVLGANAYRTDWKAQQVTVQLTPGAIYDTQVINAGKSRLYGFEVEMRGIATKAIQFYAGIGYSSARFLDFPVTAGALTASIQGNEFPRAPHWTVSGGTTFVHPSGAFLNLNASYRSDYFQSATDQNMRDISGRTLFNTKLGWQGRHFGAFLAASNIFNVQKPDQFIIDVDGHRRGTINYPRKFALILESRI